jgi:hypothetical protein
MDTITSRFFDVLKELGISITSLAAEIPNITTKQKLSNAKNGRNEVQIDVVSYICSTYPIVSCDYILTGNGPMFKSQEGETENHDILTPEDRKVIQEVYQDIIEERDRRIAILEKEIIELKIKYRKTEIK